MLYTLALYSLAPFRTVEKMSGPRARWFNTLSLRNGLGSNAYANLPQYMSAWQCLRFAIPGTSGYGKDLNFTSTRRLPVVSRPDHLLIRVEAASLSPVDLFCLHGYGSALFSYARCFGSLSGLMGMPGLNGSEFPFTPGRDFAGYVTDSATLLSKHRFKHLSIGARVAGATWPFLSSSGSGSLAEYIVCPSDYVASIPDNVDSLKAAAISYAGLTGWSALSTGGLQPRKNKTISTKPLVLVTGASGGVGLAAAQLARIWGCQVHVTCPDDSRALSMMEELEFEEVIVHPDLPPVGKRYDVIIDCVRPENLSQTDSLQGLGRVLLPSLPYLFNYLNASSAARYVSLNSPLLLLMDRFGVFTGTGLAVSQFIFSQLLPVTGGDVGGRLRWAFFQPDGRRLEYMLSLVSRGLFKVVTDEVFPFDQVPAAFDRLASRAVRGKIVVRVSD